MLLFACIHSIGTSRVKAVALSDSERRGSQSVAPSDVVARTSGRVRLQPMFRTQTGQPFGAFFRKLRAQSICPRAGRRREREVSLFAKKVPPDHKLERTTIQICALSKG